MTLLGSVQTTSLLVVLILLRFGAIFENKTAYVPLAFLCRICHTTLYLLRYLYILRIENRHFSPWISGIILRHCSAKSIIKLLSQRKLGKFGLHSYWSIYDFESQLETMKGSPVDYENAMPYKRGASVVNLQADELQTRVIAFQRLLLAEQSSNLRLHWNSVLPKA